MKKLKSGGATLSMDARFYKITPRYWGFVGCLLIGLSSGFAGCTSTVNEQKGSTGVVETSLYRPEECGA